MVDRNRIDGGVPSYTPSYCFGEACAPPDGYGQFLADLAGAASDWIADAPTWQQLAAMGRAILNEVQLKGCGKSPAVEKEASATEDISKAALIQDRSFVLATLKGAMAEGVVFLNCDMRGTDFRKASLQDAQFFGGKFGIAVDPVTGAQAKTKFNDTPELKRLVALSGANGIAEIEWVPVAEMPQR